MNHSTISANKRAWQNQSGSEYVKLHKDVKTEAQRVNGTDEDLDSREHFVKLNEDSISPGAYVSLYGENKQFANITLRAESYTEEAHPRDERSTIATSKDRFLELKDVADSGFIEVSDRFSQDVTKYINHEGGTYEEVLWDDGGTTLTVLDASSGEALGPGAGLLLGTGWDKAKFEQFMADNA